MQKPKEEVEYKQQTYDANTNASFLVLWIENQPQTYAKVFSIVSSILQKQTLARMNKTF